MKQLKHLIDVKIRMSKFFSFRTNHKKLFFPGCSLSSGDPKLIYKAFSYLKQKDSNIGLWLSCCGMPIKKFVGKSSFTKTIQKLENEIQKNKIEEIIVSCGNCYNSFAHIQEKVPSLKITSLYSEIPTPPIKPDDNKRYIVHHPCSARSNKDFRNSFLKSTENSKIQLEKTNKEHPLLCCLTENESQHNRISAIKDKNLITYCGHCVKKFQTHLPTKHVLQIIFDSNADLQNNSVPLSFLKIQKLCKTKV